MTPDPLDDLRWKLVALLHSFIALNAIAAFQAFIIRGHAHPANLRPAGAHRAH